jgi:hypothetical protein
MRIRRDRPYSSKKNNNSLEDSVGNEENGYPVPDPNKTTINITKEPIDAYKNKKNPQGGNLRRNHKENHAEDARHS